MAEDFSAENSVLGADSGIDESSAGKFTDFSTPQLEDVPMTDVLPLWLRAKYSKREPHILDDPESWRLYDELGLSAYDEAFSSMTEFLGLASIIRVSLFDQEIKSYYQSFSQGNIIIVGGGITTFHSRLADLEVSWFHVDTPAINRVREKYVADSGHCVDATDFTDIDWINQISIEAGHDVLVVFPSSLHNVDPIKVAILMEALADKWPGVRIVFDAITSKGMAYTEILFTASDFTYPTNTYIVDDIEEEVQMWADEDLQFNVLRCYGIFDAVSIKPDWEKETQKLVMRALILRAYNMHHVYHAANDMF